MTSPRVYAFEGIDESLPYIPLAGRRLLDALGRKLSLDGWLSLPLPDRTRLVEAGASDKVDASVVRLVDAAHPAPVAQVPLAEPDAVVPPEGVAVDAATWRGLRPLDRYALGKLARKPEKLARACAEIVGVTLSHVGPSGDARMVDVGAKGETARRAEASARVRTTGAVVAAIAAGGLAKGDVLAAARIAGILACKRTAELVPLCHPVRTTHAAIDFELAVDRGEVRVRAVVEAVDRTGVEMEAMVAASVASLTLYDMIKSADRWASIDGVRLEAKRGGKSGEIARPADRP